MSHDALKRLLAIQTLIKVSDREGATIGDVITGISTQTSARKLQALAEDLKRALPSGSCVTQLEWSAADESLVVVDEREDENMMDGLELVGTDAGIENEGGRRKITPSHLRGEAYEILCSIMFDCKKSNDISLLDYHHVDSRSEDDEGHAARHRVCRVKAVFMSERKFAGDDTLRWADNRKTWKDDGQAFLKGLETYLRERSEGAEGAEELIAAFTESLSRYVQEDQGFDILVDLEEVNGMDRDRHLILAQCKYRSQKSESKVDMAPYVGKYHDIVFVLDRLNALNPKKRPMLMPLFWMSTVLEADAMNYFGNLRSAGKIFFYGNTAFRLDAGVIHLVPNVSSYCKEWMRMCGEQHSEGSFRYTLREPREPMSHQKEAIEAVYHHCTSSRCPEGTDSAGHVIPPAAVIMATGSGKTLTSLLAVRQLEEKTNGVGILSPSMDRQMCASLHFSPRTRLVIQNAHEWLGEELAISKEKFDKIYYCICSMRETATAWTVSSGCSLRIIPLGDVPGVIQLNRRRGSLNRCRFFTTYQAGEALRIKCRRINIADGKLPSCPLFAIKLLDEAHMAVGRGTKSHGAGLLIPSLFTLSFTATSRYCYHHLTKIFPSIFADDAVSMRRPGNFSEMDPRMIFPQVDADAITKAQIDPQQLYTGMQWEAVDVLDSHWLWLEADSDPGGAELEVEVGERIYDWRFFQQAADSENKSIVVFFVEDIPLDERLACEGKPYYDIVLDNNRPAYFGVVPHGDSTFTINHETEAWGVNKEMNRLFYPAHSSPNPKGLSLNDMSGLGVNNRIGSVVYALSYRECFENRSLVRPSLITLGSNPLSVTDTDGYGRCLDEVFKSNGVVLNPSKTEWNLTIGGRSMSGKAHYFRSMKLLFDCLMEKDHICKVLVFCTNTNESKACRDILDSMLKARPKPEPPGVNIPVYTDIIYSSESEEGEIIDIMPYEKQQMALDRFCETPGKAVLFNVKLISLGVDLPSIDTVMILKPSSSPADITQKIGRCLRVDRRNPDKVATVLVPMWADDLVAAESPETDHDGEIWRAPCRRSYEDSFLLIKRVLDAMDSEDITMISSFSANLNQLPAGGDTKKKPTGGAEKATTVKTLLSQLHGPAPSNSNPVFDASFSKLVLSVWRPISPVCGPSAPTRALIVDSDDPKKEDACHLYIFVAFVAFCHHKNRQRFETDPPSFLWYKGCVPFEGHVHIKFDFQHEQVVQILDLFGFTDVDGRSGEERLREAIKPSGNAHARKCEALHKIFFAESLNGEKRTELVDNFLVRLEQDITEETNAHAHALQFLCTSSETSGELTGCAAGQHGSHTLDDFLVGERSSHFEDFRTFSLNSSTDKWCKSNRAKVPKTPSTKQSTGRAGSSKKKRQRPPSVSPVHDDVVRADTEDEVNLGIGSLTLEEETEEFSSPPCRKTLFPCTGVPRGGMNSNAAAHPGTSQRTGNPSSTSHTI